MTGAGRLVLLAAAAAATGEPVAVRTHDVVAARGLVWAARTDGLAVVDLSDPLRPRSVARLSARTDVLALSLSGERVALAAGRGGCLLVEAADPEAPRIVGTWNEPESVVDVVLDGDLAFLAQGNDGWRVVDFRDPARPRSLATVTTRGRVRRLALSGKHLAVAEVDGGVRVFDVTEPGTPRERAAVAVEDALDVAWAGDRLLVALGARGIGTMAADGRELSVLPASPPAQDLTVEGTRIAVSYGTAGIRLLELDRSGTARARGRALLPRELPAGPGSLSGSRLYVAAEAGAIAVLDVADPDAPVVLAPPARKMKVSFQE